MALFLRTSGDALPTRRGGAVIGEDPAKTFRIVPVGEFSGTWEMEIVQP